jgi:mannitol-specific phosphotransferase system IIBC component
MLARVGELVLQLLPLAIVCALSPWAIVAVILMLSSDRPSNSVAWVSGWTVSTFAIGVLIILFSARTTSQAKALRRRRRV